jgi:hypothetical protein
MVPYGSVDVRKDGPAQPCGRDFVTHGMDENDISTGEGFIFT